MFIMPALAIIIFFAAKYTLSHKKEYIKKANYHQRRYLEENNNKVMLDKYKYTSDIAVSDASLKKMEAACNLRIKYHADLDKQFRMAANYPWQSVDSPTKEPGEELLWETFFESPQMYRPD